MKEYNRPAKYLSGWDKALFLRRRPDAVEVKVLDRYLVFAPRVITFFDSAYGEFFSFLKEVKTAASKGKVLIDISGVEEVKAAALLVLFANIEIAQIQSGNKDIIKLTVPSVKAVSKALWKFGLWRLTQQQEYMAEYKSGSGLEICTASRSATQSGDDSQLRKVVEYAQGMVKHAGYDEEADLLAYNAITESVSNVWQHAYDEDFFEGGVPTLLAHWWIIVERIDDQVFIAVYDRGAGIPFTLQRKAWYAIALVNEHGQIEHQVAMDAQRIKLAVGYGQSRFNKDGRGKGLSDAKDFVQSNPMGTMIIYSGFGDYTFHSNTGKEELRNLPSSFGGTLIQWNLRLESKK